MQEHGDGVCGDHVGAWAAVSGNARYTRRGHASGKTCTPDRSAPEENIEDGRRAIDIHRREIADQIVAETQTVVGTIKPKPANAL